jgi:hypothetical protein
MALPVRKSNGDEQWNDGNARCFGMLLDSRSQEAG